MALNHNDSPPGSRLLIALGVAASVLSAVFLWAVLKGHGNGTKNLPEYSPLPTATSGRAVTSRSEIVSRLERILQSREAAYRLRNPELLREIYSADCPCLESDERAINELIQLDRKWSGIATSINVRDAQMVTDRAWIVVAEFNSDSLRIETEGGKLVDAEPAGSDLLEFTLIKPLGSHQWLLGSVTLLEGIR
jgi:hypothetical protein